MGLPDSLSNRSAQSTARHRVEESFMILRACRFE